MATKIEVFFVVNDNEKTTNPIEGKPFAGPYCQNNGYQVSTVRDATLYWTHRGAQALVNRLTRSNGMVCPSWCKRVKNDGDKEPKYHIITWCLTDK